MVEINGEYRVLNPGAQPSSLMVRPPTAFTDYHPPSNFPVSCEGDGGGMLSQ